MEIETLRKLLERAHTGTPEIELIRCGHERRPEPETTVAAAVAIYLAAQSAIDRYENVKTAAKELIGAIMDETGATRYVTCAGVVRMTAPSLLVHYDAHGLDRLCRTDAALARLLAAYRRESYRAGGLRITAKSDR